MRVDGVVHLAQVSLQQRKLVSHQLRALLVQARRLNQLRHTRFHIRAACGLRGHPSLEGDDLVVKRAARARVRAEVWVLTNATRHHDTKGTAARGRSLHRMGTGGPYERASATHLLLTASVIRMTSRTSAHPSAPYKPARLMTHVCEHPPAQLQQCASKTCKNA